MMQDWEKSELEEQISQAALLIKKLLVTPEDCALRDVAENWLKDHAAYLQPEEPKGYILTEFVDEKRLGF